MIDVIIPAYNSHSTIDKTLFSIAYQENIKDIQVYIINDNSKEDYSKQVDFFSNFMSITELKLDKNSGPGVARQYGIDHSQNPYIIFIDSDDVLAGPSEISTLYKAITKKNYDVVISNFFELLTDGEIVEHVNDNTWLHGKIFSRNFLLKNNIRFNCTFYNEDVGFIKKVLLYNSKIKYIEDITYFWCFNKNSLTRKNNLEDFLSIFEQYIYNVTWAIEDAEKDNCPYSRISEETLVALVNIFCVYFEYMDTPCGKKLLVKSKKLKIIFDNYPVLDIQIKNTIINKRIKEARNYKEIINNSSFSFHDFLKKIEEA